MSRQKLKDVPITADDLNAVLDMSIRSIKLGRPPKFDDTLEGLEDFKQASIAWNIYEQLITIQKMNAI